MTEWRSASLNEANPHRVFEAFLANCSALTSATVPALDVFVPILLALGLAAIAVLRMS